jgi:hypothetical protein
MSRKLDFGLICDFSLVKVIEKVSGMISMEVCNFMTSVGPPSNLNMMAILTNNQATFSGTWCPLKEELQFSFSNNRPFLTDPVLLLRVCLVAYAS